ncbi:MFS transporter [Trinickia mobilis]|uniref:MFS transporter n=1 Tax=Trinickia mobilis TaxID=2816356 RepID=UPI001A8E01A9|nr:MFS transporter [Trinickia mobilis]
MESDAQVGTSRDVERTGLFSWYRPLTANERRAFWGCKIGYVLDAMDTQFLSFVIPALIASLHISRGDAGLIGTATLLSSALGGWLAGILSDRIGRVKTLQLTVLWFASFTLLCAAAQNFEQLLVARSLMGLGFGGEWTAGAVLIGEVIRARDRGKAVGIVQAGWAIGWGLSAILFTVVFSLLPETYAWRVLFAIGILPAPFVIWIRRHIKEPDVHLAQKKRDAARDQKSSILEIFSARTLSVTLRASLLSMGMQGGYYAITTWLPTYLKTEQNLSVIDTGLYLAVVIAGSYCGYLTGSYASDRFGRKRTFIAFALMSCAIALIYTHVPITGGLMLALGFPLGFFASGIFSGMGAFLTELYPTRIRGSGQGFCYNFGRAIGATFPFLIGYVSQTMSLGHTIGVFAALAYGVVILAAWSLPETQGRELEADDTPA